VQGKEDVFFQKGLAQLTSRLMIFQSARLRGSVCNCLIAYLPQVTGNLQLAGPSKGRIPIIKKSRILRIGQVMTDKRYFIVFL